ncbi:hypothetical protein IFM89_016905 [Coptis chinensis]|uniref:Uncharacterized protein n=1 Tax=Coptis chinensis TaxID=261450 RepID=A0A835I2W4_9MAGN|nr:hypothetical protein IFM89_016905 [Coptis chinensis]
MVHKSFASSSLSSVNSNKTRKLPILLFDIMDTIVRDPFYQDIPAFFRMSFNDLIECKHPTAWVEFEKGLINEVYLAILEEAPRVSPLRPWLLISSQKSVMGQVEKSTLSHYCHEGCRMELSEIFFKDGRPLDLEGLKNCMKNGYTYINGIESLLHNLKQNDYEMHAFTNYPIWYTLIEEKLRISNYLSWTFCSCITGKRKPAADSYLEVLRRLEVDPASCVFIDDRMVNIEAAINAGMVGLHFKDAASLKQDLTLLGIETSPRNKD